MGYQNSSLYTEKNTSTGATRTIQCGWNPRTVDVLNFTTNKKYHWTSDMADAAWMEVSSAGNITNSTTLGFTPYAGSGTSASKGITLGTKIASASDEIYVICRR